MSSLLPIALFLMAHGVFYILFAFVEPPAAVSRLFKIPSVFIFFPARNQARVGRIAVGALMMMVSCSLMLRVVVTP